MHFLVHLISFSTKTCRYIRILVTLFDEYMQQRIVTVVKLRGFGGQSHGMDHKLIVQFITYIFFLNFFKTDLF